MKCCPLQSHVDHQSQAVTTPPGLQSPPAPISTPTRWVWEVLQQHAVALNPGEIGCGALLRANYCGKRGWHQEPQLPEETALETLNFNKITSSGRGGRRRQNSMCRSALAAWNTDLWTPLNHISFFLLGPEAFTHCGKKGRKNLLRIND